mmetsp:Transcript_21055/g.53003  ORF Transcript_21055/g.53003 Transcript_21055/m.53003 type:complete len:212 (-) Transcript_21055:362-997(-)
MAWTTFCRPSSGCGRSRLRGSSSRGSGSARTTGRGGPACGCRRSLSSRSARSDLREPGSCPASDGDAVAEGRMHPSGPPSHNSFGNWGGLVLLYEFRRQQFNHSSPYQKGSTCHASVLSRKVHLGKVSARLLEGVQLLPVVNDICKLVHQHDALRLRDPFLGVQRLLQLLPRIHLRPKVVLRHWRALHLRSLLNNLVHRHRAELLLPENVE